MTPKNEQPDPGKKPPKDKDSDHTPRKAEGDLDESTLADASLGDEHDDDLVDFDDEPVVIPATHIADTGDTHAESIEFDDTGEERIQKILARSGFGSRRKCGEVII